MGGGAECFLLYILEMGDIWGVGVGQQSFLEVCGNGDSSEWLLWYFLRMLVFG